MLQVVHRIGRACALVVAVVALSGAGATGAWDERFEAFASGAALEVYPAVREAIGRALAGEDEYGRVREAIEMIRGALRLAFPHPEGHPGGDPVCGFLAGTGGGTVRVDGGGGGTPRVDGGGLTVLARVDDDPLQPLGAAFAALPRRTIETGPRPGASHLVIVDRFDLAAMAVAIETASSLPGAGAAGAAVFVAGETWDTYVQAVSLAAGVAVRDADVVVPHGHLVLYHVLALLAGHPRYEVAFELDTLVEDDGDDGVRSAAIEVTVDGEPIAIHLIAVDFDDTSTLIAGMARAAALAGEHDDAVVITSWGITDCALIEAYQNSDPATYPTLSALLLERIGADPEFQRILEEVCRAFAPFIGAALDCSSDLLVVATLALLEFEAAAQLGWPGADWDEVADLFGLWGRVFASAGNQRLPFPMPPAAWPGVFGVESCVASGAVPSDRAWYSNLGDFLPAERVVAPSESYVVVAGSDLTPPAGAPRRGLLGYWGSSFAAPHAALVLGRHDVGTSVTKVGACDLP